MSIYFENHTPPQEPLPTAIGVDHYYNIIPLWEYDVKRGGFQHTYLYGWRRFYLGATSITPNKRSLVLSRTTYVSMYTRLIRVWTGSACCALFANRHWYIRVARAPATNLETRNNRPKLCTYIRCIYLSGWKSGPLPLEYRLIIIRKFKVTPKVCMNVTPFRVC